MPHQEIERLEKLGFDGQKAVKNFQPSGYQSYGGLFGDSKKAWPEPIKPGVCEHCGESEQNTLVCRGCGRILKQIPPPDFAKPWGAQVVQPNSNPFTNPSQSLFSAQPQGQFSLPTEHICIARENKKIFAFCPTGSVQALESIFVILKGNQESLSCLRAMLD
jgi:hypothetical protein